MEIDLAAIPGQCLGEAINQLPSATGALMDDMSAVVEVPHIGTVRIFVRRSKRKIHRNIHIFWTPTRAELINGASAQTQFAVVESS